MFEKMTLVGKFRMLEGVSLAMFVAMAVFGLVELHSAMESEKDGIHRLQLDINVLTALDTLDIVIIKESKLAKDIWLRGADAEKFKKYRGEFVENTERFNKNVSDARTSLKTLAVGHEADFADYLSKLDEVGAEHQVMTDKYMAQIDAYTGDAQAADRKVDGLDRDPTANVKALRDSFVAFVDKKGAEKVAIADDGYAHRRTVVIIWVVISLLISVTLATLIIRQIMRQLGGDPREVTDVVNTMASGDFSRQPAKLPESGSLLANAYQMQGRLRDMISGVKAQANQVGDMAHTLAVSANQIAGNVHQESDAVSSMAAAIEELSVSTSHISERGLGAARIAKNSRSNAEQGAQVVNKTVARLLSAAQEIEGASVEVSRLGEDASRISEVVKVIKEIADQTNLLALNAAIEAARAGEQGRGFAVVADEVRKLAERTAGATSEINQMSSKIGEVARHALSGMDSVVKSTQQGVGDAEVAQQSISNIQGSFGEVAGVIDEIAVALDEQNSAATDLARSTERVSQMSEENAGAANSLLRLAEQLEGKAREVRQAVEAFTV